MAPEVVAQKDYLFFDRLRAAGLVLRLVVAPGFSQKHHLRLWLRHVAWGADAACVAEPASRPGRGNLRDGQFGAPLQIKTTS